MNKIKWNKIAKKLYFTINDDVLKKLNNDYATILEEIKLIKKIDTTNTKPMFRIDETRISFMREDVADNVLSKKIIINNAPETYKDFIVIKKAIHND